MSIIMLHAFKHSKNCNWGYNLNRIDNLRQGSIHVKAVMISGVYDIPAKSDVLGFGSHRGEYACTRCLHPGKVIQTGRGINALQIINFNKL